MNTRDAAFGSKPMSSAPLVDVQSSTDTRHIAINKVGIRAIRHPVKIAERGGGAQRTVATFSMTVGLPQEFKGTHMSRFVEILNAHEREISVESFGSMLQEMAQRLEAKTGHIEMRFPYFIDKAAPVSGVRDRKSTRLNSSHLRLSRMPSSA